MVKLNERYVKEYVTEDDLLGQGNFVAEAHKLIYEKSGLGNDFLGWVTLPSDMDQE